MGVVLRMALGGMASGFFLGTIAGAILGLVYAAVVGNAAWGLDGALVGGALLALAGAIYGAIIGRRDVLHRADHGRDDAAGWLPSGKAID